MSSDAETLGSELREARQGRELSLDQVEQQLRIRAKFLEALEQGNYAALPSAVQARGFLRNYARFLGLDPELMVSRYDEALQGGRRRGRRSEPKRQTQTPPPVNAPPGAATPARRTQPMQTITPTAFPPAMTVPRAERPPRPSWLRTLAIGVVVLALLAVVLVIGSQRLQVFLSQNNFTNPILNPQPATASPTSAPAVVTQDATAAPVRPTPLPNPNTPAAPVPSGPVAVQLKIVERTWLRVIVDGEVKYMGSAPPETVMQYQGNSIQLRVANAVGVHAVVNGQDLGVLGARGQIVDQTFTANGTVQPSTTPPPRAASNSPGENTDTIAQPVANTSPRATFSLIPASATPRISPTFTILPTFPPSATFTATGTATHTPTDTLTPTITRTPSVTRTPTNTYTPSLTYTPSITLTPSATQFFLPRETSTPESGETRPK